MTISPVKMFLLILFLSLTLLSFIPLFVGCNPDIYGGCPSYNAPICNLTKITSTPDYCYSCGKAGCCSHYNDLNDCKLSHPSCHIVYSLSFYFADCDITIDVTNYHTSAYFENNSYRVLISKDIDSTA